MMIKKRRMVKKKKNRKMNIMNISTFLNKMKNKMMNQAKVKFVADYKKLLKINMPNKMKKIMMKMKKVNNREY